MLTIGSVSVQRVDNLFGSVSVSTTSDTDKLFGPVSVSTTSDTENLYSPNVLGIQELSIAKMNYKKLSIAHDKR